MKILHTILLMCMLIAFSNAHNYHSGVCPRADPQQNFDMKKFLGPWFAIKKTKTSSECIIYNITESEPDQFKIQQVSMNYLFGLVSFKHKYSYTGELEVRDEKEQANMTVRFPLSKYRIIINYQ